MGKLVGILMVLLIGLVGLGLYVAPGWMAAQIVAVFGVPPPDDRSLMPRLKTVVMEALVKVGAPCAGVHRIEAPRQVDYDAILRAVCMNGAAYDVRFKPTGEIMLSPNR
ncbi:MAG: hypothetical protein FD144_5367 [Rhodospirillaceae bacterium]|nr:MAG: hypothetical protein FD144_5367 [Rhodospirillaceae bacterium]